MQKITIILTILLLLLTFGCTQNYESENRSTFWGITEGYDSQGIIIISGREFYFSNTEITDERTELVVDNYITGYSIICEYTYQDGKYYAKYLYEGTPVYSDDLELTKPKGDQWWTFH